MIEIRNLQKVSSGNPAIDIPALDVEDGEIAALVGPTGSGKMLFLDLLSGKTPPTAGTIRLAGIDPFEEHQELSQAPTFSALTSAEKLTKREKDTLLQMAATL